jgi:hypothetical protein
MEGVGIAHSGTESLKVQPGLHRSLEAYFGPNHEAALSDPEKRSQETSPLTQESLK